jgi:hypothetical protein
MVDGNLAEWYATLPTEWKHTTIGIVSEVPAIEDLAVTEKWPGEQHIYNDVPLASIVNDYRVCRIFCRRVIIACLNWLSISGHIDQTREYNQSLFVIQKMVDDISACVPFHLDYELQVVAKEMGQEQNGKSCRWDMFNSTDVYKLQLQKHSEDIHLSGLCMSLQTLKQCRKHSVIGSSAACPS